jgi:hypothetical protein
MKKMMLGAAAVLLAAGMSVSAQNRGGPGPRFADADKDGKCDICGRTPGQGPGQVMRQGRGPGRGMMRGRMGCGRGQCGCCGQQQGQQTQRGQTEQQNQQEQRRK